MNLQDLTKQVADALGPEWSYQEPPEYRHWQVIAGLDGAAVTLRLGNKGRLRISGVNPEAIHDHEGSGDWWPPAQLSIGCSVIKRPNQIVQDIRRRLLPGYLSLYRESIIERDEYLERVRCRGALLEELVAIAPGNATSRYGKGYLKYSGRIICTETSRSICRGCPSGLLRRFSSYWPGGSRRMRISH